MGGRKDALRKLYGYRGEEPTQVVGKRRMSTTVPLASLLGGLEAGAGSAVWAYFGGFATAVRNQLFGGKMSGRFCRSARAAVLAGKNEARPKVNLRPGRAGDNRAGPDPFDTGFRCPPGPACSLPSVQLLPDAVCRC